MSQQIKLEIIDDQVKVTTPYNAEFVDRCRKLRGQWKQGSWWFDDSVLEYVRELMLEHFHTTGENSYEDVNLLVKDFDGTGDQEPVILFGRTIAKAFGRDGGAKLGDDIILIKGRVGSGGSVKNWRTYVYNATFEIQKFPKPALQREDVQKAIAEGWLEIKESKKKRPVAEIEAEILQLEKRIAELKSELGHGS